MTHQPITVDTEFLDWITTYKINKAKARISIETLYTECKFNVPTVNFIKNPSQFSASVYAAIFSDKSPYPPNIHINSRFQYHPGATWIDTFILIQSACSEKVWQLGHGVLSTVNYSSHSTVDINDILFCKAVSFDLVEVCENPTGYILKEDSLTIKWTEFEAQNSLHF